VGEGQAEDEAEAPDKDTEEVSRGAVVSEETKPT